MATPQSTPMGSPGYPGDVRNADYRIAADEDVTNRDWRTVIEAFKVRTYSQKPTTTPTVAVALGSLIRWIPENRLGDLPGSIYRETIVKVVLLAECDHGVGDCDEAPTSWVGPTP